MAMFQGNAISVSQNVKKRNFLGCFIFSVMLKQISVSGQLEDGLLCSKRLNNVKYFVFPCFIANFVPLNKLLKQYGDENAQK